MEVHGSKTMSIPYSSLAWGQFSAGFLGSDPKVPGNLGGGLGDLADALPYPLHIVTLCS